VAIAPTALDSFTIASHSHGTPARLTHPSEQLSHARVWRLAGPIILSNISVPLVGAVDTAVMGHMDGPHYLAAIALGALVFSFLYWGFGFLRMGTTGFVARDFGRDDRRGIHDTLMRALMLSTPVGRDGGGPAVAA
jgi:Na+-driven multidrug efflux pump